MATMWHCLNNVHKHNPTSFENLNIYYTTKPTRCTSAFMPLHQSRKKKQKGRSPEFTIDCFFFQLLVSVSLNCIHSFSTNCPICEEKGE